MLRGAGSHAVLRVGARRHRPAHADQLNVDIWVAGSNVALDPGTFRYSSTGRWANALADESVHNVPTVLGHKQAERRGRFFWSNWTAATLMATGQHKSGRAEAAVAKLLLARRIEVIRLVARLDDRYLVVDRCSHDARVRWNLPSDTTVELERCRTTATGTGFRALLLHGKGAAVLIPDEGDPASGWESWTYGVRTPVVAVTVPLRRDGWTSASFGPSGHPPLGNDDSLVTEARALTNNITQAAFHRFVERLGATSDSSR